MHRRALMQAALLTTPLAGRSAAAGSPIVVLELFTSQGCSSCPPADALLGELVRRPGVIALAWHIDYWNSLGWRDPYARPEWTERQTAYAKHLTEEVFTPALVVNGTTMVVGSDRAAVQKAMAQAAPPSIGVTLRRIGVGLEVAIEPAPSRLTAILATYDPQQATEVGAGENDGRRLLEYRVVRDATSLPVASGRLTLPPIPDHRGAVLMLQDESWHVVGAADLPPVEGL